MQSRVDHFEGTSAEYVSYLEQTIVNLRQQLQVHSSSSAINSVTAFPSSPAATESPERGRSAPIDNSDSYPPLRIVHFEPEPQQAKKRRCNNPAWMQSAKALIDETPRARNWDNVLMDKGIFDIMTTNGAVTHLLDNSFEPNTPKATTTPVEMENGDVLSYVKNYARATATRVRRASVSLALANFQKFLVLSSCAVLLDSGVPVAGVLDTVRICIGTNATDKYCKRTLRTAKYLNTLIDTLDMNGWGYRASELLLVWNRTPSFYYTLACSVNSSLEHLKDQLCREELTSYTADERNWTPIFVPSLIHNILHKHIE
ncbi:hypothetical protein LTR09_010281 [Extremus antarcticus]|uniref:Uncharacterized protein n=1 Tax=Extremus antarcticus TaxID=702011 RepID=A0AAJ0GB88_9PEZI|nr:hypothetical protein LTR09_010281 [Extremus antarcticus]